MNSPSVLLCAMTMLADPPAAGQAEPPPATELAPPPALPEPPAAMPEPPPAVPTTPVAARPQLFPVTMAGLEVLVPRKPGGRLFEQPLAVAFESEQPLGPNATGGLHGSIGYAQLTRTEYCRGRIDVCIPMLGVTLGGVLRLTTRPDRSVVGWVALGAGIGAALNPGLGILGVYGRADAGVDLRLDGRRLRLGVGWIQAGYMEAEPRREPGPQRYLVFTLSAFPFADLFSEPRRSDRSAM